MNQDIKEQNDNQNEANKRVVTEEPSGGEMTELELALKEAEKYKELADLPSRDVLLSMFVGTINQPMGKLVGVLSGAMSKLSGVLTSLKENRS